MKKDKARIVERSCVICHKQFPKKELMRFVLDKDRQARLDLSGKAQGRGAYLCRDFACIEALLYGKKKCPLKLDAESRAILEGLHAFRKEERERPSGVSPKEEKVSALIGLAYKAGKCVLGRDAIKDALSQNEIKLLLVAKDIAENSLKDLRKLLVEKSCQTISLLSKAQMAKALGKSTLALVGVNDQGFADRIMQELLS